MRLRRRRLFTHYYVADQVIASAWIAHRLLQCDISVVHHHDALWLLVLWDRLESLRHNVCPIVQTFNAYLFNWNQRLPSGFQLLTGVHEIGRWELPRIDIIDFGCGSKWLTRLPLRGHNGCFWLQCFDALKFFIPKWSQWLRFRLSWLQFAAFRVIKHLLDGNPIQHVDTTWNFLLLRLILLIFESW